MLRLFQKGLDYLSYLLFQYYNDYIIASLVFSRNAKDEICHDCTGRNKSHVVTIHFLFVTNPSDTWIIALIISVSGGISGLYTLYLLVRKEKLIIRWQSFSAIKKLFKNSIPFFFSSSASIIKQQFTIFIIGISFSMSDVAIYDLANKLVAVPMNFIAQINNALFPKVIKEYNKQYIKKLSIWKVHYRC